MKRRILRISVLLLLGAIVNIAVAWAGFLATDARGSPRYVWIERWVPINESARSLWNRHASDGWAQPADIFRSWHGLFASGWSLALSVGGSYIVSRDATNEELRETFRGSGTFQVEQFDCGFPFGSMRIERWMGNPRAPWFQATAGQDGWSFLHHAIPKRVLPVRFAINTVFYAAILWGLFAAPFALRRRRRIKGGLCPKCAYPVGARAVCTECGTAHAAKPAPKAVTA